MTKKLLLSAVIAATTPFISNAAEFDDDIHQNDYKWMQVNLMAAVNELPGESNHDYMELEFGGRSGLFDLYGYVDVFNLTSDSDSDKANAPAKMFMKFAPRMSIDALTGKDLSLGAFKEFFVSSEITWDGHTKGYAVNQQKIGLGANVDVPLLGTVGMNVRVNYDSFHKDWNGVQFATNWFKPVYFLENGTFVAYQGYIDYMFGMKSEYSTKSSGGAMFNGIYWHSDRYAVGYGLKAYKTVYGLEDGGFAGKTTGFSHYFAVTYKF